MNIKQLIQYLQQCDPDSVILVASNEKDCMDDNIYSELDKITISPCKPQGYQYELTDDEGDLPAVILYP